jgi:hypothetical protein
MGFHFLTGKRMTNIELYFILVKLTFSMTEKLIAKVVMVPASQETAYIMKLTNNEFDGFVNDDELQAVFRLR